MGGRYPNPRRVKIHRSYSVDEAARACGVHKNTIRRWLKQGLEPIEGKGQTLILGPVLRSFLERRRLNAKCPLPPGFLYCLRCRARKEPAGRLADLIQTIQQTGKASTTGNLKGLCPDCLAVMNRKVTLTKLASVQGNLDITVRDA